MEPSDIPKIAVHWTLPGKKYRGQPKESWWRLVEKEMNHFGWTWGQIPRLAAERVGDPL
jgi:hypothetical protein